MKATELLKKDHDAVKALFKDFEDGNGDRKAIAEKIFNELEVHETIEEERFYPEVRSEAAKKAQMVVKEGIEEHHVMDLLIKELRGMSPDDEQYVPKMTVLRENVEHHIQEEEKEMFPAAEKAFSKKEMDEIGQEMERRKQELKSKQ